MSELIKHSFSQQLMYPDELAYSLKLIPTPDRLSQDTKNKLIITGVLLAVTAGISFAAFSYYQKKKKTKAVEYY
jgi:hypothetical protein